MDLMERRRELMRMGGKPDTSPKIAEYDMSWGREKALKNSTTGWCITDWYKFDPQIIGITIVGYVGNDGRDKTFQYHNEDRTFRDWYYFNVGDKEGSRQIQGSTGTRVIYEISFSVYLSVIENSYAYVKESGQIFFAGKNTPYYGYTNINDMPQT